MAIGEIIFLSMLVLGVWFFVVEVKIATDSMVVASLFVGGLLLVETVIFFAASRVIGGVLLALTIPTSVVYLFDVYYDRGGCFLFVVVFTIIFVIFINVVPGVKIVEKEVIPQERIDVISYNLAADKSGARIVVAYEDENGVIKTKAFRDAEKTTGEPYIQYEKVRTYIYLFGEAVCEDSTRVVCYLNMN